MSHPFHLDPASGALSVPLHVLHMSSDGRIPVPNSTKELFVEIGTNAFLSTHGTRELESSGERWRVEMFETDRDTRTR